MCNAISKEVLKKVLGVSRSSDNHNSSYFYGESQLRYFKDNTRVYNIVGPNGNSKEFVI